MAYRVDYENVPIPLQDDLEGKVQFKFFSSVWISPNLILKSPAFAYLHSRNNINKSFKKNFWCVKDFFFWGGGIGCEVILAELKPLGFDAFEGLCGADFYLRWLNFKSNMTGVRGIVGRVLNWRRVFVRVLGKEINLQRQFITLLKTGWVKPSY